MVELPPHLAKNIGRFTGRAWLLAPLLDWWDSGERLVVLTGDAGTGKSMIAAWLAGFGPIPQAPDMGARLDRIRQTVRAVHFCQAASGNIRPRTFAERVSRQLRAIPGFSEAQLATLADRVTFAPTVNTGDVHSGATVAGNIIENIDLSELGDEHGFDRGFIQPVTLLYDNGYAEPMLLIVDGLDEAIGYTGNRTLPDLLSKLTDLPPQVRILVTTRTDPRVLAFYDNDRRLDLIGDAPADVDDVREYIAGRLAGLLPQSDIREASRRIAEKARGVFLYAAMVLDDVLPRLSQVSDLLEYPFPEGLSRLYRTFFARELGTGRNREQWHKAYKPMLGLIAIAQGDGLTAERLANMLAADDVSLQLEACKQYLNGELPHGPFRLFHKSLAEFLLDDPRNRLYHIDAAPMHRRVGDYYWRLCQGNGDEARLHWSRSDVYGFDWLATHLFAAGEVSRLASLISRDWMEARLAAHRPGGFIADVELGWRGALQQSGEPAIVEGLRCGLIRTSFNSISEGYSPALVARAFEEKLWTLGQVLAVTANLKGIAAVRLYAAVLTAPGLARAERLRLVRLGMEQAQQTPETQRASAFAILSRSLEGEPRRQAVERGLDAARMSVDAGRRAQALTDFTNLLTEPERSRALLEALDLIERGDEWRSVEERLFALIRLAPLLDSALAARVLPLVSAQSEEAWAVKAALIPQLAPDRRAEVVAEALERVRSELGRAAGDAAGAPPGVAAKRSLYGCLDLLAVIAPFLAQDVKRQLLFDARDWIRAFDPDLHFRWLFDIAPQLEPQFVALAMNSARGIPESVIKARAFAALAPVVSVQDREQLLREAEDALRDTDPVQRARGLTPWIGLLDGQPRRALARQILTAAIDAVGAIAGRNSLTPELAASLLTPFKTAIPHAPDDLVGDLLQLAMSPRFGAFQDELLGLLAPKVSGEALRHRLSAVIRDEYVQVIVLCEMARRMIEPDRRRLVQRVLPRLAFIQQPYQRAKAAAALIPLVDADQRHQVIQEGLTSAGQSGLFAPIAIAKLAAFVTPDLIERAVEAIEGITGGLPGAREESAAALAALMPDMARAPLVVTLLSSFRSLDDAARGRILDRLIPACDGDLAQRCLEEARRLADPSYRAKALALVSARLTGDARISAAREAESAAAAIVNPFQRATTTALLAQQFEGEARARAVAETASIVETLDPVSGRAEVFTRLLPLLSDHGRRAMVANLLEGLPRMPAIDQAFLLERLVPHLTDDMLERAAMMSVRLAKDTDRARLAAVAYRRLLETADSTKRQRLLDEVAGWLFSLRNLSRARFLDLCRECLFEGDILTPEALTTAAGHVQEIASDWRFDAVALAT
jgi:hypothetical protein